MDTERAANNRKIAEWLEPIAGLPVPTDSGVWCEWVYSPMKAWLYLRDDECTWEPRDFYSDEVAVAMLLEAMSEPILCLDSRSPRMWSCWADCMAQTHEGFTMNADRKTAVADSFLAWKSEAK